MTQWLAAFRSEFGASLTEDPGTIDRLSGDMSALTQFARYHGGSLPQASAVLTPSTVEDIQSAVRLARHYGVVLIPRGGGSSVVQGIWGSADSIILDLLELDRILVIDETNYHVTVQAGVIGEALEERLNSYGLTLGHFPQSIALASIGGFVATKSSGQASTLYGGIEEMVTDVQVVLGTGEVQHWGHRSPRRTAGPELLPLIVGSEGTLGIITEVTLKIWPNPTHEVGLVVRFPNFSDGIDQMRNWFVRRITPTVIRLYDESESRRTFPSAGPGAALLTIFSGSGDRLDAELAAAKATLHGGTLLDESLVSQWMSSRNDVSAWEPLLRQGFLVDTLEVSGNWSTLAMIHHEVLKNVSQLPGVLGISAHSSHAYLDGANLYFTFLAEPPHLDGAASLYHAIWDMILETSHRHQGTVSHHHGVGRLRRGWMAREHGQELEILRKVKALLDPDDILNRGVLWP